METNFKVCTATTDEDLHQILDLQKKNLRNLNSRAEEDREGFVTVCHSIALLRKMNETEPHVIIKRNNKVAGYALCMSPVFRNDIPELKSMFLMLDKINNSSFDNSGNYLVMGQICVDKDYRGQGLFRMLYEFYFDRFRNKYDCILTEVAMRNTRSLNAHFHLGFQEIYRYVEPGMEEWAVLIRKL